MPGHGDVRMWRICALVALVLTVAGCATTVTGEPRPQTDDPSALPPRPRELPLQGKDPCDLIPRSSWGRLYIEKAGKARENELNKPSLECVFPSDVAALNIVLVVTEGIEEWTGGQRFAKPHKTDPIEGFPAIVLLQPGNDVGCAVLVDVASGQYLQVTVIPATMTVELPEKCEYAREMAETAMSTLVA